MADNKPQTYFDANPVACQIFQITTDLSTGAVDRALQKKTVSKFGAVFSMTDEQIHHRKNSVTFVLEESDSDQ